MKTFIGKLVFQIIQDENNKQFDIQHRIFFGKNKEQAEKLALEKGISEEETICSEDGKLIRWKFCGMQLRDISEVENGFQFDSQTHETSCPELYLQLADLKLASKSVMV